MGGKDRVKINLNGESHEVESGSNVSDLLQDLQITNPAVAVEINASIVTSNEFEQVTFKAGDVVEIVSLVGGG